VESSQIVQFVRCQTVWSLACFVGISWRTEPRNNPRTVSSRLRERHNAMRGTDSNSSSVFGMVYINAKLTDISC